MDVMLSVDELELLAYLHENAKAYGILGCFFEEPTSLARNVAPSEIERRTADRLKMLPKYEALFFSEGQRNPVHLHLTK